MEGDPVVQPGSWPVAVGGVGGSGTRVVAAMLDTLGYQIGEDLNEAFDNLWFTLLFKYREAVDLPQPAFEDRWRCFENAMHGRPCAIEPGLAAMLLRGERAGQHPPDWLAQRLESLASGGGTPGNAWAWKEPNTHIVLERLFAVRPDLRYVHVMRNGLDMAVSANQNQLRLWGPRVLGDAYDDGPRGSLAFWRWAHQRIFRLAREFPGRILVFDYDAMCEAPAESLPQLLEFLGVPAGAGTVDALRALVRSPGSRGRFRAIPPATFDPGDVAFVRSLGYPVA